MNIKRCVIALFLILVMGSGVLVGCTSNQRVRTFGGTVKVQLPPGQKLVNATWKEANLWYVVTPRKADEKPVTSEFIEDSNFGVMNGKIIFIEQ